MNNQKPSERIQDVTGYMNNAADAAAAARDKMRKKILDYGISLLEGLNSGKE